MYTEEPRKTYGVTTVIAKNDKGVLYRIEQTGKVPPTYMEEQIEENHWLVATIDETHWICYITSEEVDEYLTLVEVVQKFELEEGTKKHQPYYGF